MSELNEAEGWASYAAEQERHAETRKNRDRLAHEVARLRAENAAQAQVLADVAALADRAETNPSARYIHPSYLRAALAKKESVADLIERSSLGTPEAKALRDSVSDEVGARIVERSNELAALAPLDAPAEEECPNFCRSGVVECWSPGGPCAVPNRPGCETCGPCNHCAAPIPRDARVAAEPQRAKESNDA